MKKNLIILSLAAMFSLAAEAQDKISLNFGETPKREVRAVWLTTVKSLDWPDTKANSPENIKRQQKELTDILDKLQKAGVNLVLMQSRVRASTIYKSDIEPWDQNITGQPGKYPGYDPLQFAIEQCITLSLEQTCIKALLGQMFKDLRTSKREQFVTLLDTLRFPNPVNQILFIRPLVFGQPLHGRIAYPLQRLLLRQLMQMLPL